MTFDIIKKTSGRQACTIFEIDLDINDTALDAEFSLDPTSYGTPKTTQDVRAYDGSIRTYRYSSQYIANLDCFSGLESASSNPPKANPGIDIGFRATASVSLMDFESNDSFELQSPYNDRRVIGSHWAKLFARNFVKNRPARIRRGYLVDGVYTESNFQTEHYIVDEYQGPTLSGKVSFNLVDVLALTNGINAKAPETSNATLNAGIDNTETAITVNLESGLSAAEIEGKFGANGATGFIAIGDEYVSYTVTSATGAAPVTMILVRGQFGTIASSHEINATVQKCIAYDEVNIITIIDDLIRNHTDIDQTYIPSSAWAALEAGELSLFTLTNVIAKETEVKKLLNELVQIAGLTVYVDVVAREIVITATPNFDNPVIVFDTVEHLEVGTLDVKNDFNRLITRQLVQWAPKDYSKTEASNFTKSFRVAAILEELPDRLGTRNDGKEIITRWLPNTVNGNQIATGIAQRNVSRFSQIPQKVTFEVDTKYIGNITAGEVSSYFVPGYIDPSYFESVVSVSGRMWLGSVFQVVTPAKVYSNGAFEPQVLTCQCTSISAGRKADKWKVEGIAYQANIPPNSDYFIPAGNYLDYILANEFSFTEAKEYIVVISSGAIFGSTGSHAAFRQGSFPIGATLRIVNQGQIIGRGGNGGNGGGVFVELGVCSQTNGGNGLAGGAAIEATTDLSIDNSLGLIGGGGGGGAGTPGNCPSAVTGNGGGGGQGYIGGSGGAAGIDLGGATSIGEIGPAGTINYPGTGVQFNSGGGLGEAGQPSLTGQTGGAAGAAIITNGNIVTITAGNNAEQIKGAIV
ncbi:hypothetical protein ORI99_00030 [Alishewanella sp. SMS9]|nr:hypothetical protein [Alishewanella sp. SMS9]